MEKSQFTLDDITFPIERAHVFTTLKGEPDKYIQIPGKTALINSTYNKPISVVSSDYEIITNEEAYHYGETCLRTLFGMDRTAKIKLFNVFAPKSRSFCHIDLIKDGGELVYLSKDEYTPFVRITNSYNAMFRLSFDVGFCRSICYNGMIMGGRSIRFAFSHVREAKRKIDFALKKDEFEEILKQFKSDIQILIENPLPREYIFPMFCKALQLKIDLNEDASAEKYNKVHSLFEHKLKHYDKEVGSGYYSLYNVITDIATSGFEDEHLFITRVNSRQKKAGVWLSEISDMLRNGEIDYEAYLKDFLEISRN